MKTHKHTTKFEVTTIIFKKINRWGDFNPAPRRGFMILEIRPHDDECVVTCNFFVSQRPAVILSENDIQAPAGRTIWTEFLITSFSISKIDLKVQIFTNCRAPIRGAIAHVDDITLRCNHSTSHMDAEVSPEHAA